MMSVPEITGVVLVLSLAFLVLSFEIKLLIIWFRKKQYPAAKFSAGIHFVFFLGLVSLLYAFFIEPYWLEVKHVDIFTEKLKQTDFTLVQISDLHCDRRIRNEERVVAAVNRLVPDIIVFTGDSLNTEGALPAFKGVLRRLDARLGKAAVKGNWDIWYWRGLDLFGGTGFTELKGRPEIFSKNGEQIAVWGFDPDQRVDGEGILRRGPPGIYRILLFHYPGINEEIGGASANLILSGHTHGGQVALPFYGALVTLSKYGKTYESGAYRLTGGSMLYVNRGIGMEGGSVPRIRFFARPEITVFHIRPAKAGRPAL